MEFLTDRVYTPRFGEALRIAQENLDCKNYYAFNPEFDKQQARAVKTRKDSMR